MLEKIKKTGLANSLLTIFLRGIGVLMLFGISIAMTQFVDAEWVGYYEFSRVILMCLSTIALLGTDQTVLYFAGKFQPSDQKVNHIHLLFKRMSFLVVGISAIFILLFLCLPKSFLISLHMKSSFYEVLHFSVLFLPFYALTVLVTETFRAYGNVVLAEVFRNILKYASLAVGIFFIAKGWSSQSTLLDWYLYGFIFLVLLGYGIAWLFKRNKELILPKEISFRYMIKKSYPIALSSFYTFLLMTIDLYLIGQYLDAKQVAYYAIPMKVMSVLSLIIVAVNTNFAKDVACYFHKDQEKLQSICTKASKFIAMFNIIMGSILLIFKTQILMVFGTEYLAGENAYTLLISIQMIVSLFGLSPMYLNMSDRQHVFHRIMFFALIINLVSNLCLIPTYHLVGAAISYGITVLFWNTSVAIYAYKKDNVRLMIWR